MNALLEQRLNQFFCKSVISDLNLNFTIPQKATEFAFIILPHNTFLENMNFQEKEMFAAARVRSVLIKTNKNFSITFTVSKILS